MLPSDIPRHRFTSQDVAAMVASGILQEGSRVELIDGELIVPASEGPIHAYLGTKLARLLHTAYPEFLIREGHPLVLTNYSEPEPDLVVALGTEDTFRERHPTGPETALVIEIAHSSLKVDRAKAAMYAASGVPHYWILNVEARVFEYFSASVAGTYQVSGQASTLKLPGSSVELSIAALL